MDQAEGFFPERELLAYRRSLLAADPTPESAAKQKGSAWWLLFVCMSPVYMNLFYLERGRPILIFGSFLVACALVVAVVGICTGLRTQQLITAE